MFWLYRMNITLTFYSDIEKITISMNNRGYFWGWNKVLIHIQFFPCRSQFVPKKEEIHYFFITENKSKIGKYNQTNITIKVNNITSSGDNGNYSKSLLCET